MGKGPAGDLNMIAVCRVGEAWGGHENRAMTLVFTYTGDMQQIPKLLNSSFLITD